MLNAADIVTLSIVPTLRRDAHFDAGRNKPVRALSAGQAFPAFLRIGMPETPALAVAGRAYFGLHSAFPFMPQRVRRSIGTIKQECKLCLRWQAKPALQIFQLEIWQSSGGTLPC